MAYKKSKTMLPVVRRNLAFNHHHDVTNKIILHKSLLWVCVVKTKQNKKTMDHTIKCGLGPVTSASLDIKLDSWASPKTNESETW
jgi:hypothetical protein